MSNTVLYKKCRLCARGCGVDRTRAELGFCSSDANLRVARAALHHWEEPPISGTRGSGTIFFSGCSLGCIFCQNREISRGHSGIAVTIERLADIMLELEDSGAHNVNLVTPTHFVPSIINAVELAKVKGLKIPIVYNTGTYDTAETIKMLDGIVDIYMPDMKYYLSKTAAKLSLAHDYPQVSRVALDEMVHQKGQPLFDSDGIMQKGVIVRILLLPSHVAQAKLTLKYVYEKYGDSVYISLMNQYTPMAGMSPPLNRRVTRAEYDELVDYADRLGVTNGFVQDFGTAADSFIPLFDNSGVEPTR